MKAFNSKHARYASVVALAMGAMSMVSAPSYAEAPANMSALHGLVQQTPGLTVNQGRPAYKVGDVVEVEINVPAAGWLNILQVGPDDKVTLLFPNKYSKGENEVDAGVFRVGAKCEQNSTPGCFKFVAGEPTGTSLVAAVWTSEKLNLWEKVPPSTKKSGPLAEMNVAQGHDMIEKLRKSVASRVVGQEAAKSVVVEGGNEAPRKIMGELIVEVR